MSATPIDQHLSDPKENIFYARIRRASRQFIKYCMVGASGYVIYLLIFIALIHAGIFYLLAGTISFCVSATNNFLLNKFWTFGNPRGAALNQAGRFLVISLSSLAVNLIILRLLLEDANIGDHRLSFIGHSLTLSAEAISASIAISAVTILNFAGNKMWSFRQTTS